MVKANLLSCGKWYPCCKKAISEGDFTHALCTHLLCRWDNAIMSWEGETQHEALLPCAQQSCECGEKWEDNEEKSTRSLGGICASVSLDVCARYSWLISWQIGVSYRLKLLEKCQGEKKMYSLCLHTYPPPFQAHRVLLFIPFACLSYSVEQENSCRQHCLKW